MGRKGTRKKDFMRFKLWLLATLWVILIALWLHTPMFVWVVSSEGALRVPLLGVWLGLAALLIMGSVLQLPFTAYQAMLAWWKTRKKTQGFCALAAQEWSQAEQYLQQEDPFWAALAARGQGAFARSLEHLKKVQVTSLIPAKAVDLLKAENYVDLGDYAQAKILLEHIAPLKKHKAKIALLLIQCYERLDLQAELTQAFQALPRLGLEPPVVLQLQQKIFLQLLHHCQTERMAWQLWKPLAASTQEDARVQMAFLQHLISIGAHKSAIRHAVQLLSRGWHEELVGFLSEWGKEDLRYVSAWAKKWIKSHPESQNLPRLLSVLYTT